MSDSGSEFHIHSAERVAKRALAQSAYCCRGFIERGKGNPDAESVRERMIQWITRFNLIEQLGKYEWDRICSPLGGLAPEITNRMTWEAEGLAVLAWALGRGEMPKHDDQVNPYEVTDSVLFLDDDAGEVVANASLLGSEELQAYRELMYAIHCRLRDFLRNGGKKDFTTWIEARWLEVLHVDTTRIIVEGDLAFQGKVISVVERERLTAYEWCIQEQHRASIWIVGEDENYWETNADT